MRAVLQQRRRAHPRSRGENGMDADRLFAAAGSSPLTRGKPHPPDRHRERDRLIPAHAGKTRPSHVPGAGKGAHPRSRGENMKKADAEALKQGSSPLTRGKRYSVHRVTVAWGLIPAHAGKTQASARVALTVRAHPRSRGENASRRLRPARSSGSSPLTRGKHCADRTRRGKDGLIPAHAGKTRTVRARPSSAGAHPRSRGENRPRAKPGHPPPGSSPLTRGKPDWRRRRSLGAGLIPAHAGKTHIDT